MPNRLAQESSPYLLQHRNNPVDWFPWGEEAFQRARDLDRPVLLSVGYSACHWCHVMERESFENTAIAEQMNQGFVSIKVDREERPDVDSIYMSAVQSITGRGGWPMTVFLTPQGVPFYGGTYFPLDDGRGMPGFPRVLDAVLDAYRNKREDIEGTGQQIIAQIAASSRLQAAEAKVSVSTLDHAFTSISKAFDPDSGGFGRAPKFPQPMTLSFLARHVHRTADSHAQEMLEFTLRAMANGGMYDQVAGGFHRYSTDSVWLVPHFEKMLYDNALLARAYLDAYRLTGQPVYRQIVEETLDYVLREMTDASGGFYSTQDADSEGQEGKFFLWSLDQFNQVVGGDSADLAPYFGLTKDGNFEGANILNLRKDAASFAAELGEDPATFADRLRLAKEKLYRARQERIAPDRDEKILASWNGLMLRAFAEAGFYLGIDRFAKAARQNADFLLAQMRTPERLLHSWKDGTAKIPGFLDDYAAVADGLIALYSLTFAGRYLTAATELSHEMVALFWDEDIQGFFDTGNDQESLVARPRDFFDNATPAGTSLAAGVLLQLSFLTGDTNQHARAAACLQTLAPYTEEAATSFGYLLAVADALVSPPPELALVWSGPRQDAEPELQGFLDQVRSRYLPGLVLAGAPDGSGADLTPLLVDRPTLSGAPTAYLCQHFVCQMPVNSPSDLGKQIAAIS